MTTDPYVAAQLVIYRAALDHLAGAVHGAAESADVNHIINSARIDVLRFDCPEAHADQRLQKGAEVLSTLRTVSDGDVARAAELAYLAGAALDEALAPEEVALGRRMLQLDRELSEYASHNVPGHLPPESRRLALVDLAGRPEVGETEIANALAASGLRLIGRPEPSLEI